MLFIELEGFVEALAQFGQVLQGAAQESHVAADGAAARQAGNGLRDHRLENGGSDVFLLRALVQKGLHIRLGEDTATAGNGIQNGMALRQLVQAGCIGVQQGGHLVDEGARAAGARAVHALLDAVVEVDDLGILATELDGNVGFRDERLYRRFRGDNLLDELQAQPLGKQQAARPGDGNRYLVVGELGGCLFQHLEHRSADVSVMATVHRVDDLVVSIEHRHFHRGGTDVDAQVQGAVISGGCHSESPHIRMGSPGLMNRRRMAISAISSEVSFIPVSIQWFITPRYAEA